MKSFRDRLLSFGDAPALASVDDQVLSYLKLVATADRIATRLDKAGVQKGDRIIATIDNWALQICFILAASWVEADIVLSTKPDVFERNGQEIDYIISTETDASGATNLRFDQSWLEGDAEFDPKGLGESLLLINSSGSTGFPKIMGVSVANMLEWAFMLHNGFGKDVGPRLVTVTPYSSVGLLFIFKSLWDGQLVIGNRGDMEETMKRAKSFDVRELFVTPLILEEMCQFKETKGETPDFEHIVYGGAMAHTPLIDKARSLFPKARVAVEYGATEIGMISYGVIDEPRPEGWLGYLVNEFEYASEPVDAGDVLKVRPPKPSRMIGYVGGAPIYDVEGWYFTSDLVENLSDGSLCFQGRADHVMNLGGVKISHERLEAKLAKALNVTDLAVAMDEKADRFSLVVFASEPFQIDERVIKAALKDILNLNLEVRLKFVESLPRVENGKLNRHSLAKWIDG